VPPIYQPEVAATAVLWAADHGKREVNVGSATVKARLANIVAPGLLDRLLSTTKRGYEAQQTAQPVDLATWQDNVDKPVDEDRDHGAHGVFDDRAKPYSVALWATMHKPAVGALIGTGVALAAAGLTAVRRR
jgi:hypothetical protein